MIKIEREDDMKRSSPIRRYMRSSSDMNELSEICYRKLSSYELPHIHSVT